MAKTSGNNNMMGVSFLVLIGSLLYVWVVWSAWSWNSVLSTGVNMLNVATVFWALLYGVAATSSVGLLFMSLGSFMGGWRKEMQDSAKMAVKWGGITLVAISLAASGGFTWFIEAIVGFVLIWFGLAWAMM